MLKFLCLVLFIGVCYAGEADVLELGDNDFSDVLAQYETALVMFYAPW